MGKKSIRKNYIYNVSYQILLLITPLLTAPYLSRVLKADGIGTASFVESNVSYFVLAATFGTATFGQREISYVQDDREKRSIVFWETKMWQIAITAMVTLVYFPFTMHVENRHLYWILSLNLLSVAAGVTWFFQGMEEFGRIVLRNLICKILNILFIFCFVRTPQDLPLYVFGTAFFTFIGDISMWFSLPKYIDRPDKSRLAPLRHARTIVTLFIPSIAIQVYTVLDKTMIGLITGDAFQNGYYEQAVRISKMTLTIVTALGTVMIPRIGYHYGRGEKEVVRSYMYRGYRFVWFLGVPLSFGLLGIAAEFVPWFLGPGYEGAVPVLRVLGFLVLAIGINNVTGMQYLIPTERQNLFTMTVVVGAAVNFCMNIGLIPLYGAMGAAIASVSAETVIALVQLYLVRKELSFWQILRSSICYLAAGTGMLAVVCLSGKYIPASGPGLFMRIGTGALVYFVILLLLRDRFLLENARAVLAKVRKKR